MTATKIHAAVCRKFGAPLTVEQLSLAAPGDGELQVRVAFCAICHGDIHYAAGAWGGRLPAVYGHEAAGVVEAVGAGVDGATVGDQVVVTLLRACGRCHHCARGESQVCGVKLALDRNSPLSDSDGNPVAQGLRTAAFAERTVVHHSQVVVIDKEIPLAAASLLACGVITGHGAVTNTAGVRPGSSTATIGAGGVGLNCIQGAKACGAHANIAVDVSDAKLKAATAFGATHVVNPGMCDAKSEVRAITKGGADYVFVAVGSTEAVEQGLTLLRRGGALVLVGMPAAGATARLEVLGIADKAQRILGSKMGAARIHVDIPQLIQSYRAGRLKLDELISARYPLAQINEAIAEVKRGAALRNLIAFE